MEEPFGIRITAALIASQSSAWMGRGQQSRLQRCSQRSARGVYSPDGTTIQFDNGTIWQRDITTAPRFGFACEGKQRSGDAQASPMAAAAGSPTCNGRAMANR
jgi:hypothetical protein